MKWDLYQVYLICFLVGLFFALISAFFSGIFGGFDHGMDAGGVDMDASGADVHGDMSADHGQGIGPLNSVTIATFITTFGGVGAITSKMFSFPPLLSLPAATASGFGVASIVFFILARIFSATESSSEAQMANLAGTEAEVSVAIPSDGLGEVVFISKGTRYNKTARSEDGTAIPKHARVALTKVVGGTVYAREMTDEKLRRMEKDKDG